MTKREQARRTAQIAALAALGLSYSEAETLRRASMTLHRWAEMECNFDVERREDGKVWIRYNGGTKPHRIADRETPALKRCEAIASKYGLRFYHQTDPRGAAVYIGKPDAIPEGKDVESYYMRLMGVC